MVQDINRQRIYIANSGLNRVEVFDMRAQRLLAPIKVGQLPRSLALSPDGLTLYVANSGGESISIIDLDALNVIGAVRFPALPFNTNVALVTPRLITSTQRGPLAMMSNGTLSRIVGQDALPQRFNTAVRPPNNQGVQVPTSPSTMASSPNGETAIVLAGNGFAYLYDALLDDFVQSRQVVTAPITGYYGPIAVGPRGQYFLVNGLVLNQALTPTGNAGTVPGTRPGPACPPPTSTAPWPPWPPSALPSLPVSRNR
ncbi:MAG: YncE family protein [Bryobacterales bacterium]|nr:YncE family protein [Bryobacterales bacterium]